MYLTGSNSIGVLIPILFPIILLLLEAILTPVLNYRSNREIKSWTGTIPAKIVSIRLERHFFRRYGPWENEYPTLEYMVNGICYQKEYRDGKGQKGTFRCGDTVYIRYNHENPECFIIECDYRVRYWKTDALLSAITVPFCLAVIAFLFLQVYLENHAFLFLECTWTDMEESFKELKDRDYMDNHGMNSLDEAVSNALAYHDKLEYQISLTKSPQKKLEYQARLEDSTYKAGASLAEYYADYTGQFLYRCGQTELRAQLHDSMLYQFLDFARSSSSNVPSPSYTWEDLVFFGQTAAQLETEGPAGISQPEEAIGLSIAATELKLQTAMESFGTSQAMKQTLCGLLPGYWDSRLTDLDQRLSGAHDSVTQPPLDYSAVWTVHAYMLKQYCATGDFETSVLDTCAFAGRHLGNRRNSQNLQSATRLQADSNPFTNSTLKDPAPKTAEEIVSFAPTPKNAARDLLQNWRRFTLLLDESSPARFDLCLLMTF